MNTKRIMKNTHYIFVNIFLMYIYLILNKIIESNKIMVIILFSAYFFSPWIFFLLSEKNIYVRFCSISGLIHVVTMFLFNAVFPSSPNYIVSAETFFSFFFFPFYIFLIPYLLVFLIKKISKRE